MAASKLFLSPQGLSKIIRSLEDECGAQLFSRTKEGLVPTESGKLFYDKSKVIVRDMNDMFTSIEAVNDKEKRFKIGFAAGTLRVVDIPCVKSFMESNPEILASWCEVENERVLKQLLNDEIGFGFVVGRPNVNNVVAELVSAIELVIYVYKGHPLWDASEVGIADIREEAILSMSPKYHIYHDVINACHMNGFNPNIVAELSEGESIYKLVMNKIGLGILPRFFADTEEIRAIHIKDAYTWDVYGVYRTDSADVDLAKRLLKALPNP